MLVPPGEQKSKNLTLLLSWNPINCSARNSNEEKVKKYDELETQLKKLLF
jgi:hypothetical protein